MEKFIEYINEASAILKTIDHLLYVTFPVVREKNLLIKIMIETRKVIANCINAILQYEYLYKRIKIYKDPKNNLETFIKRCAKRYNITEQQINKILELFKIVELHKTSPMEFIRDEKLVILSENSSVKSISLEKTKEFLQLSKDIFKKTKDIILGKI